MIEEQRVAISRWIAVWFLTTLGAGLLLGCTTTHIRSDTDDSWETPARFDRVEDDENEELLFRLHDHRNWVLASLYRKTPAYPDVLLPHALAALLQSTESADFEVERADGPLPGWLIEWNDGEEVSLRIYAASHRGSTYFMIIEGDRRALDDRALLTTLREGFSPADIESDELRDDFEPPPLADGLSAITTTELRPVDASGHPRDALIREFGFSNWLSHGYLLKEPTTITVRPENYLHHLLNRLDVTEATEVDGLCDPQRCLVTSWENSGQSSHFVGVHLEGTTAYQFQLRAPANPPEELQDEIFRWMTEFLDDPQSYFEELDAGDL